MFNRRRTGRSSDWAVEIIVVLLIGSAIVFKTLDRYFADVI